MVLKKITAIFSTGKLERIEQRLRKIGVGGITVVQCKGYGEYESFLGRGWSLPHARIEIYCTSERAQIIARSIMEEAHTGSTGDGIVAIEPVEQIYRIRTKAEALPSEI
jgi:nitrogen regulatory protein P-II 1